MPEYLRDLYGDRQSVGFRGLSRHLRGVRSEVVYCRVHDMAAEISGPRKDICSKRLTGLYLLKEGVERLSTKLF